MDQLLDLDGEYEIEPGLDSGDFSWLPDFAIGNAVNNGPFADADPIADEFAWLNDLETPFLSDESVAVIDAGARDLLDDIFAESDAAYGQCDLLQRAIESSDVPMDIDQSVQAGGNTSAIFEVEILTQNLEHSHSASNAHEYRTSLRINHNLHEVDLLDVNNGLDQMYANLCQQYLDSMSDGDRLSFKLINDSGDQLYVPPCTKATFKSTALGNALYKVSQSNRDILQDGIFTMYVTIYRRLAGGVDTLQTPHESLVNCHSVRLVHSTRNECGHRAVFIADYTLRHDINGIDKATWNRIRDTRRDSNVAILDQMIQPICDELGLNLHEQLTVDSSGLGKYANYFQRQIVVFEVGENQHRQESKLCYIARPDDELTLQQDKIFLLLVRGVDGMNHFHVITKIHSFLGCRKFCMTCMKPLNSLVRHFCRIGCSGCNATDECEVTERIKCDKCGHECRSHVCLEKHKLTPNCKHRSYCEKCDMFLPSRNKHQCLSYVCGDCKESYTISPHHCFIKPLNHEKLKAQDSGNVIVVAFDIESMFVENEKFFREGPDIWIDFLQSKVSHTLKRRHRFMPNGRVADGYDAASHTVYNYYPCDKFGCSCLNIPRDIIIAGCNRTADQLYSNYQRLHDHFVAVRDSNVVPDLNIVEMWDCQFRSLHQTDAELRRFCESSRTVHDPNLVVAMVSCDKCYKPENVRLRLSDGHFARLKNGACHVCGTFLKTFKGHGCVRYFGDWLYNDINKRAAVQNIPVRVFAHNFKAYDGRFIFRDFFNRNFEEPRIIMQGSKILSFETGRIRFQDSLNLFLCSLSKIPASFKYDERVKKGKFPFWFNTPEHQSYLGPLPDIKFYGYDNLSTADKADLQTWYNHRMTLGHFDLQEEMLDYCISDTEILMIAINEFRKEFRKITGLDPIRRNFTLPSICFEFFRSKFLQEKTIGITPIAGYGRSRKASKEGNIWIDWKQRQTPHKIVKEQKIGIKFADGYIHETQTIYEYNGCRFHGCLVCFPVNRDEIVPGLDKSPNQLYDEYQKKIAYYKKLRDTGVVPNLQIVEVWGHAISQQKEVDSTFSQFYKERKAYYRKLEENGGVALRDAYFGGRTNNRKFFHVCASNETLQYKDFTSLYPAVLYDRKYPIGHPEVIRSDFDKWISHDGRTFTGALFGFVKCRILPPARLQFPVLPARINDRLEFVLCRTCASEKAVTYCEHADEERALTGTFVSTELEVALHHGYQVLETYEILQYSNSSDDLFKTFIREWMRVKQESSGYPDGCETPEQKEEYIADYEQRQGIKLIAQNITKDPVKRTLAKNQLNSFYGKFAQRPNLPTTRLVSDYHSIWSILEDNSIKIVGECSVADDKILFTYEKLKDDDCRTGNTSVAIAAMVTAYARLELFKKLHEVETRSSGSVIYYDTDSIVYVLKDGEPDLPVGTLLGELTDELGSGVRMNQIVCLGPKNYAYETVDGNGTKKVIIKCKGITIDARALQTLNFESSLQMARQYCFEGIQTGLRVPQTRIRADPHHQILYNQELLKVYRALSEKRMIIGNDTVPYGFRVTDNEQLLNEAIAYFEN